MRIRTLSPRRRVALAWTLACLSAFGPLATDMYLPAFPGIAGEFSVSIGAIQLTLAVFLLGLAAGQLLWGTLSDHTGRRLPLLAGCALFAVMAAWGAAAASVSALMVARFFMGLGASAGVVVTRAIVRDLFEEREAANCYSLMMIVGGIAPIVAPFLGSMLLTHGGWRGIFWALTGFGALCVALALWQVEETLPHGQRMRGRICGMFQGYGKILMDRRFLGPALAMGCASGLLFTYIAESPFIFIEFFGVPTAYFGFLFATNAVGLYLGGRCNAWLLQRFTAEWLLRKALWFGVGTAALLVTCAWSGRGGLPVFFTLLFINLSSLGIIFPNATALTMQPFAAVAGSASALLGIFQFILGAVGGALVSVFHNGTALPLAAQIACYALLARGMLLLTVKNSS
ncbi:MAG: multidrug effflux MFS transporter [Verrucomicrobiales bacterium]|nr:multidrug effflux MFS transporter [Verrucomicrobiales bacterium]